MNTFFEITRNRMPHFFNDVSVLEHVPHNKCKTIWHLFHNSNYVVVDPNSDGIYKITDNSFNVAMSINYFHNTKNYVKELQDIHRVSSKLVMFSCQAAGNDNPSVENLTEADFYSNLDIDFMFERHQFDVDYAKSMLYFWGIKRSLSNIDRV